MIRKGLLLILLLVSTFSTFATHLRGGYITIDHVQGNTYKITLIVYVKTIGRGTNVLFSHDDSGILNFGDNSKIKVTQQEGEPRLDLDPSGDISEVVYSVNHEYTKGWYRVSYEEANRSGEILNIDDSFNTPFYIESAFKINEQLSPYHSPKLIAPINFYSLTGKDYSISMAAIDTNDYSLFYYSTEPWQSRSIPVYDYFLPASYKVDMLSGLLTWNTPVAGVYTFDVLISQFKGDSLIGYIKTDFNFIFNTNSPFVLMSDDKSPPNRIKILKPNETFSVKVILENEDQNANLTVYSELLDKPSILSFTVYDSITPDNKNLKVGLMKIKADGSITRDNPYTIAVRGDIEDGYKYFYDLSYQIYTNDVELHIPKQPEILTEVSDVVVLNYFYPDRLILRNLNSTPMEAKIYTMQGHLIMESKSNSNIDFNLSLMDSGIYLLKIEKVNYHHVIPISKGE